MTTLQRTAQANIESGLYPEGDPIVFERNHILRSVELISLTELAFWEDTGDRLSAAVERFELVPYLGHPRFGLAVTRSREEVRHVAVKRHVDDQLVVPTQSLNVAQKSKSFRDQ